MNFSEIFRGHFVRSQYLIFEQDLSSWTYKPGSNSKFICGQVEKEEFFKLGGEFLKIMPNAEERFDVGDICYGAKINGHFAHIKWISFNRSYISEIENTIRLAPDSVYLYDGYTLPEYRGLRLTSIVLDKTFEFLSTIGIKRAYSFILPNNSRILKSKERENAHKIGAVRYFRLFKLKFLSIKGETVENYKTIRKMFRKSE